MKMKTMILMRAEKQLENYVNKHGYDYNEGASYVKEVSGANATLLWEQEIENGTEIEIRMTIEGNEITKVEEKKKAVINIKF